MVTSSHVQAEVPNPILSSPQRPESVWAHQGSAHLELENTTLGSESPGRPMEADGGGFSFWAAVFNFLNSIVGAGIIGLAFALNEAGFWLGLVMMIGCGWLTDFSVRLLVDTGARVGKHDYELLCEHAWGRPGFTIVSVFMFAFAFGAMLAYLIIIGDTVPVVLEEWTGSVLLGDRTTIIFICATCICLPLSSLREIGKLAHTSALSIAAVVLIIIIVIARAPATASELHMQELVANHSVLLPRNETPIEVPAVGRALLGEGFEDSSGQVWAFSHGKYFQAFGAISFAFVCQHSSFLVRNSLREPRQWNAVTHTAVASALALSLTLSITGYSAFSLCTRGDILNNFKSSDNSVNSARLLLAVTMFFTYPMEFFVARQTLHGLIFYSQRQEDYRHCSAAKHWSLTLSLWAISVFLGVTMKQEQLGLLLELSGGLSASALGFVLPAALAFKLRSSRAQYRPGPPIRFRSSASGSGHSQSCSFRNSCSLANAKRFVIMLCQYPIRTVLILVGLLAFCTSMFYAIAGSETGAPGWCPATGTEN